MSDTGDGVCCECDTIGNPFAYWSFTARPVFEGFVTLKDGPTRSGRNEDYVSNPLVSTWDCYANDYADAPDRSKWALHVLKVRAKGVGKKQGSENKSRMSSFDTWKVRCFSSHGFLNGDYLQDDTIHAVNFDKDDNTNWSTLDDRFIIEGDPGGFGAIRRSLNSYKYNRRCEGLRTWACYHDGEQSKVVVQGTCAKVNHRYDPLAGEIDVYLNNSFYHVFDVVDIATQDVDRQATVPWYGYDSILYREHPEAEPVETPVVYGYCEQFVSRANLTANPWFSVFSSYDDWGDTINDGWIVGRSPIDSTMSFAGGHSNSCPTSEYCVVRAAYHSYTSGPNPVKFPRVIAVKRSNRSWASGYWITSATIPNPDPESSVSSISIPRLVEADTVLVRPEDGFQAGAVLLCFQHIRGRELAIWLDPGTRRTDWSAPDAPIRPTYRSPLEEPPRTVYATAFYRQSVWLYDSEGSFTDIPGNPKLTRWAFQFGFEWPPGEGVTLPNPCDDDQFGKEDDGLPFGQPLESLPGGSSPPTRNSYLFSGLRYIPTFITCDREGYVYVGSPDFIQKCGRYASKWNGNMPSKSTPLVGNDEQWFLVFNNYWPTVPITTQENCSGLGGGGVVQIPVPKVYGGARTGRINYGNMNSREFAILPTSTGIHVRGCEGFPEMATTSDFNNLDYYSPYKDSIDRSALCRSLWITDWIFSFDGKQRVPCIEEAYLSARVMSHPKDWAYTDYAGPVTPADYTLWSENFALVPTTFKFVDYMNYVNVTNQYPSFHEYETYHASKERSSKYWVSRRYCDELLYDFFAVAPLQAKKDAISYAPFTEYGLIVSSFWETATNWPAGSFSPNTATFTLPTYSTLFLPDYALFDQEGVPVLSEESILFGLDLLSNLRVDKGWNLDYKHMTSTDINTLWDNVGIPVVSALQRAWSWTACWTTFIYVRNTTGETPHIHRGILLDVVDIGENND